MDRFEKGMLVRSKAGHDAGEIFIITGTEDAYVYLADGRLRTLQKPKKKKKKHVQIILQQYDIQAHNLPNHADYLHILRYSESLHP